jgi:uncharacterized membrane protein
LAQGLDGYLVDRRRRAHRNRRLGAPSRGPRNSSSESPKQVLKRLYAKGEIDHATYQRMLTELKG